VLSFTRWNAPKGNMRHIVDSSEVAHLWMHQAQDYARSSGRGQFYFQGNTIYSYGTHFPIAKHVENKKGEKAILLTTCGYSSTTSRHICETRQAIPSNVKVFRVPLSVSRYSDKIPHDQAEQWWKSYVDRLAEKLKLASSARKRKVEYFDSAKAVVREANEFAEFYNLRQRMAIPDSLEEAIAAANELADKIKRRDAAKIRTMEKKRLAAEEVAKQKALVELQKWINNEPNEFHGYSLQNSYFRLNDGEVQTSRGARFPLKHGERAYRILNKLRSHKKTFQANGKTLHVGHYEVDSMDEGGNIVAGCHMFEWSEIERFAKVVGCKT